VPSLPFSDIDKGDVGIKDNDHLYLTVLNGDVFIATKTETQYSWRSEGVIKKIVEGEYTTFSAILGFPGPIHIVLSPKDKCVMTYEEEWNNFSKDIIADSYRSKWTFGSNPFYFEKVTSSAIAGITNMHFSIQHDRAQRFSLNCNTCNYGHTLDQVTKAFITSIVTMQFTDRATNTERFKREALEVLFKIRATYKCGPIDCENTHSGSSVDSVDTMIVREEPEWMGA